MPRHMSCAQLHRVVLFAMFVSSALCDTNTVTYSDFRGYTFSPLASQIAYELTPCGCTSSSPVPTFTFTGVTKSIMTRAMLNTASESLFDYMSTLMTACSCTAGVTIATEGLAATPEPASDNVISKSDVDTFTQSIANSISSLLNSCCNPQVSTRTYTFISGEFTYDEAVADAKQRGGTIATIASRNDCMRVSSILRSVSPQSTAVSTPAGNLMFTWLGLKRTGQVWQWATGATYAFSNWGYQQPSVSNDCAAFTVTDSAGIWSTWAALSCTSVRLPYLLETPAATGGSSGSETIIIVAIIVVLVVVFIIATIFILLKRFVPAFRGRAGMAGGRRATPEERERREAAHRRRERRRQRGSTTQAEDDEDEMDPVAPQSAAADLDNNAMVTEHARTGASPSAGRRKRSNSRKHDSPSMDLDERGADMEDGSAHREAQQRALRHTRRHTEGGSLAPPRDGPQQVTRRRTSEGTPTSAPSSALTSPNINATAAPQASAAVPPVPTARRRAAPPSNQPLPVARGSIAVPPPTSGSNPAAAAPAAGSEDAAAVQQQRLLRARMIREQQRRLLMQAGKAGDAQAARAVVDDGAQHSPSRAAELQSDAALASPDAAAAALGASDDTPVRMDFSDVEPMEAESPSSAFAVPDDAPSGSDGMSRRSTNESS